MPFKSLILEKEDSVATLSFNRPDRLNSMTWESSKEFHEALMTVDQDPEIFVLIITGQGRGFSSGADKDLLKTLSEMETGAQFRRPLRELIQRPINLLEQMEKPVIAAVNGPAAGGGVELALACDFRIASDQARFIFTEVTFGMIPDGGGIPRLTRMLGVSKAKEIILTGQIIDGREAERIGLVNKCVPPDQLLSEAKQLARRLRECSPLAVGIAKRMIDQTVDMDLMNGLDVIGFAQIELLNTQDFKEGVKAMIEKRKPVFKGK